MFFETLENRSMFSVSLTAGVLTVTGTDLNDAITVNKNGAGQVSVNDNGVVKNFTWGNVNKIIVNALGGSDNVAATDAMTKPMTIRGGAGMDYLRGGGGADVISGDDDSDWIDGGALNDDMSGGAGLDIVSYADRVFGVVVTLDDIADDGKPVAGPKDNCRSDIETVHGTNQADSLKSGGAANVRLYGFGGNDNLNLGTNSGSAYGGEGVDVLLGGNGTGYNGLYGGPGNDSIYGYGNQNSMHGEAGNDYLASYGTGTTWCYGGDGDDTAMGGNGMIANGGAGNDTLYGSYSSVNMNWLRGDAGDDVIYGGSAANEIRGGDGNDKLHGVGTGTNWIYGDNGDDKLWGTSGGGVSDLRGGAGNDQLFAGGAYSILHGDEGDDTLVSLGGSRSDVNYGDAGFDSFWVDAESTEKVQDLTLYEALLGTEHRIGSFGNGVSRERIGQHFAQPTDAITGLGSFSDRPLFATDGPTKDDINQGAIGDCYFLATLGATAKIDPNRIRQSVVDLGDGTYAVQFWSGQTPVFERVDGLLATDYFGDPKYAGLGHQDSTWVAIMEKAFTHFRTGANTYASISAGWMNEVFTALRCGSSTKWSWTNGNELLNYISDQLNANKAVTIGTKATVATGSSIVGLHAYMIERVSYGIINLGQFWAYVPVSVTMRNPWGWDGAGSDSNTSDGYVTVTAEQANASFSGVISAYV